MSVLEFKNKTKSQISEHFNAYEFRCKCGKSHTIYINTDLINLLEIVRQKLNASKCVVVSGYRCSEHDKKVGGSGKGPHTKAEGADVEFYDEKDQKIPSKTVCLLLEDMNHQFGVGYRSGNNEYETHIDLKNRGYKYYFDEGYKPYKSCNKSFYKYFGIKKESNYNGKYPTLPKRGYFYAKKNIFTKKYKIVDTGEEVEKLQRLLNWALNINLKADGKLGEETSNAIIQFQILFNLKVDGKFGKKSLTKAKEIVK